MNRLLCAVSLTTGCVPSPESDEEHGHRGGEHRQGAPQRDRVSSVGPSLSG